MTEKNILISRLYESCVKDVYEPLDANSSFVEKTDDVTCVFSQLCTKHHVWVVDDIKSLHVRGVITESDTIQLFAQPYTPLQSYDKPSLQSLQYGLDMTAEDIMSSRPIMVVLSDKIIDVISKMKQHNIKQVAVIDDQERLIGEVTLRCLISEYIKRSSALDA